jgi:hypothetical protein
MEKFVDVANVTWTAACGMDAILIGSQIVARIA